MNSWNLVRGGDHPQINQRVLVMDVNEVVDGEPTIKVATYRVDPQGQPPDTYWDVEGDQQYGAMEKWTHWSTLHIPKWIVKMMQKALREQI